MKAEAKELFTLWLAAFLTVLLILFLLQSFLDDTGMAARALIVSGLMVPLMRHVSVPLVLALRRGIVRRLVW